MMMPAEGERYTVRRKFLKLLGGAFHVYGPDGQLVAYCRQKALRLREDMRLYKDESRDEELLVISARQAIDFSASYDVSMPTGERIGVLKRKGFKSSFYKDAWVICDENEQEIATLEEQGKVTPLLRRLNELVALIFPQRYHMVSDAGEQVAAFRQHFNPFIFRLGVAVHSRDPRFDDLLILSAASVIAAIEGRQS